MPPGNEVKLDIIDIDIKRGRISMKANTATTEKFNAIEGSDEIGKKLRTQECFEDVSIGTISAGADDAKIFPVTIKMKCM